MHSSARFERNIGFRWIVNQINYTLRENQDRVGKQLTQRQSFFSHCLILSSGEGECHNSTRNGPPVTGAGDNLEILSVQAFGD
jgi:hypothetical protein